MTARTIDVTNNATFQIIFEQSPISTQIFSPDGTLIKANKAWEALMQVNFKDVQGYNILQDPQLVELGIMPLVRRAFEGESVTFPPVRYIPDKTIKGVSKVPYIWTQSRMYPIKDSKGKIVHIILHHEDITNSKKREDDLLVHSQVLESMIEGVSISNEEGTIVYTNSAEDVMFGYERGELVGKHVMLQNAYPPKENKRIVNEVINELKHKGYWSGEWNNKRKDGSTFVTASRITGIDIDGKKHWVCVQEDITDYKNAQDSIRHSQEHAQETSNLLTTILETAPIGFCLFDTDLRYKMINKMLADINGISPEGHIGKTIQEIIPSINDEATRELKQVLKTGEPILGIELTGETKAEPGVIKHWREDYFPVRSINGEIIGIGALVIDVTEQKKQERQKDEFLGIASHELKTPVTSLKAFGQVIQSRLAKKGDESSVALLGKMDAQINKLTTLIQDLLDISKIEGGRLQFHNEQFSFDSLVTDIIEEVQRTTEKHDLIIEGKTDRKIVGDRDRIGQVLINFLTNAIKYSPHDNKIIIHLSADNDFVKLCVQDFGVGIPKDNLAHVFERFYRVKGKTHDTVPGMGLGLYIASEIIKRQGGEIWAESEQGKGSMFCFTLPLKHVRKVQEKNTLATEEMQHE